MRRLSDLLYEMQRRPSNTPQRLDNHTVERVLSGTSFPEELPAAYQPVNDLLQAAFLTRRVSPNEEFTQALAAVVRDTPYPTRRKRMITKLLTAKVAGIAVTVVLSASGVAAAATGSLPAPAQDAVSGAADHVGLNVPKAAEVTTTTLVVSTTSTTSPHPTISSTELPPTTDHESGKTPEAAKEPEVGPEHGSDAKGNDSTNDKNHSATTEAPEVHHRGDSGNGSTSSTTETTELEHQSTTSTTLKSGGGDSGSDKGSPSGGSHDSGKGDGGSGSGH